MAADVERPAMVPEGTPLDCCRIWGLGMVVAVGVGVGVRVGVGMRDVVKTVGVMMVDAEVLGGWEEVYVS